MPSFGSNFCGYLLKTLAILFGVIGIILTVRAGRQCDFINVDDTDGDMLDLIRTGQRPWFVFGTATKMRVGIFKYEILRGSNVAGCVEYPEKYFQIDGYPSISTAQLCSLLAPIFCAFALIATLVEFCMCSFMCSNIFSGFLYVCALGIQCGTFALIADPVFCFEDSELDCSPGGGMYMSVAAVIFYFFAACFSCCAPYTDPCYQTYRNDKEDYVEETTTTTTRTSKRAVVVDNGAQRPQSNRSNRSFQSNGPNDTGGRAKARPSNPDEKYDKFGNRVFY